MKNKNNVGVTSIAKCQLSDIVTGQSSIVKGQMFSVVNCHMSHVSCRQKGSILIEAFIAVMVIGVAFAAMLDVGTLSIKTSTSISRGSQANFLMKESLETVRSFRDGTTWAGSGLGTVNTGGANPYYFTLNTGVTPNTWTLTSGIETTGIFARKIVFDKVSRDPATQNIETTYNAAHDDANTRKVTATVSFSGKTLNLVTYFTNWK